MALKLIRIFWVALIVIICQKCHAQGSRPVTRIFEDYKECTKQFREATRSKISHPDAGLPADVILRKYGYPAEKVEVVTQDGYIITMFRIPHGRKEKSPLVPGVKRKAIFLTHGAWANSHVWLVQPYDRNFAMLLADSGFDVFLDNMRGTRYSRGHVNPDKDYHKIKYWDFSFHEIGNYDIPAQIETILSLTGQEKLYYIGYSMSPLQFMVALASHPELNDKIATAFHFAPVLTLKFRSTPFVNLALPFGYFIPPFLNGILGGRMDFTQNVLELLGPTGKDLCAPSAMACGACSDLLFRVCGYDGPQTNYTALPLHGNFIGDTISTKTASHFIQNTVNNRLAQYDYGSALNMKHYGQSQPPRYDLSKITAPNVFYNAPNDHIVVLKDLMEVIGWLNPQAVKEVIQVPYSLFTHADFALAIDADELVYKDVRDKIRNSTYG